VACPCGLFSACQQTTRTAIFASAHKAVDDIGASGQGDKKVLWVGNLVLSIRGTVSIHGVATVKP
jgi:hypothetical protein